MHLASFLHGVTDRYTWQGPGSSYVLSDLLAAVLWAQLAQRQAIQSRRRRLWARYHAGLTGWARRSGAAVPSVPVHCEPSYHLFYLVMETTRQRDALIAYLARRRIQAVFHYVPLHLSPQGRRLGGRRGQLPVTESVAGRLLRLPFHLALSRLDQDRVITAVQQFPS